MNLASANIVLGSISLLLGVLTFLAMAITRQLYMIEPHYPRTFHSISRVCYTIYYFTLPIGFLIVLCFGWNFAPTPLYFAWLGSSVCLINLSRKAIKEGREFDEMSFDNLALDILIAWPIYILFLVGTVAFLFAISFQAL